MLVLGRMTDYGFRLRPIVPADGPAFATLLAQSADAGRFQVSSRFQIPPWDALRALHGDFEGVVAESDGFEGLAGAGLIRFGRCQYEGELRPYAFLNSLVVHPVMRRRGLAAQIADARVERAHERVGEGGVIYAGIQRGNTGSVKTAARWSTQTLRDCLTVFPMPAASRAPRSSAYQERALELSDGEGLASFVEGVNTFHAEFNFYAPETAEGLRAWCEETPLESQFRHLRVAVTHAGEMVAGLAVIEGGRIRTTRMVRMPVVPWLLNHLIRIVPKDGLMREIGASRVWFRPGHEDAVRHLWRAVRNEWRDRGSAFMIWTSPRSPLQKVLEPPPWMPRSSGSFVVRAPVPASENRPIYSS
ncbi:MAG: GNAT family N-acetyltransferase [Candidatus Eiseniibacteriota bacterium]